MKLCSNFIKTLSIAFACMVVASCTGDEGDEPIDSDEGPDETMPTDFDIYAYYYGNYYGNGAGNYGVNLTDTLLSWDSDNQKYVGSGHVVYFEFNANMADNADFPQLEDGTYLYTSDAYFPDSSTFGNAYVVTYSKTNSANKSKVVGGELDVVNHCGLYKIKGKLLLDSGEEYLIDISREITFINHSDDGNQSNLTTDVDVESLTQSRAIYWGEAFTEASDYCSVLIAGSDYNLDENDGESPAINIALNITPGSDTIPEGTYNVVSFKSSDDFSPFTMAGGIYYSALRGYFGTWYYCEDTESSMLSGSTTVKDNGNGNYTFSFDLADGYGNRVTGSYTGTPKATYY